MLQISTTDATHPKRTAPLIDPPLIPRFPHDYEALDDPRLTSFKSSIDTGILDEHRL